MRRDLLYIADALFYTERVLAQIDGFDLELLSVDTIRLDAVLRNLQVIGEAVKHMPEEARALRPDIPWTKIAGIRNRLVHRYFTVRHSAIVNICANHLIPLRDALREIAELTGAPVKQDMLDADDD